MVALPDSRTFGEEERIVVPNRMGDFDAKIPTRQAKAESRSRPKYNAGRVALFASVLTSVAVLIAIAYAYQPSPLNQTITATGDSARRDNRNSSNRQTVDPQIVSDHGNATSVRHAPVPVNDDAINAKLLDADEAFSRLKIAVRQFQRDDDRLRQERKVMASWIRAMVEGRIELRVPGGSSRSRIRARERIIPLVYVPPGSFQMGHTEKERIAKVVATAASHFDFSVPAHPIRIDAGFFIGVYEIPVIQYQEFLYAQRTEASRRQLAKIPVGIDQRLPATNVDWESAVNFCKWLSEVIGSEVRLPTEIEWEYAARGNQFVQHLTDNRDGEFVVGGPWPVRAPTLDRSWCGCIGMNSNVQEWCLDAWNEGVYRERFEADAQPFSYKHAKWPDGSLSLRVVRGSSYQDVQANRDPALRRFKSVDSTEPTVGFRIVVPIPSFLVEPAR